MTETVKKIKNVTNIMGWSQNELATRSGVNKAIISRAFNDVTNPTIDTVEKLLKPLGLEIRLYKE